MTNIPNSNLSFNLRLNIVGCITFLMIFLGIQLLFSQTLTPEQDIPSPELQEQQTEQDNPPEIEENNPPEIEEPSPETPMSETTVNTEQIEENINQEPDENVPQSTYEDLTDGEKNNTTMAFVEEDNQLTDNSQEDSEKNWKGKHRIFKLVNDYQVKSDEILTTLVMIAGNASIHGSVTGNVLIIGGNVELASGAYIKGKLQVIGGQVIGDRKYVENISQDNGWNIIPAATKILMHPHTVWDLRKHSDIRITIAKFVFFTLAYLLLVLFFPKPINAISTHLTRKPILSILFGILTAIVIPVVAIILILSIIGIPCLMLGISLLVPFALCGKAGIFFTLGSTLLAGRLKPLSVIFGYIPYFMATEIPYIDWITFIVFNTIGIGLCILLIISGLSTRNQRKINNWSDRIPNNAV
ncbi:hypothetical protein C6497_08930 [Candidatus Poribacteria bacterium]|nr:MAG: hypothetical protein C6497_08930 [Candidatus Poribacteria bacterium]